MPADPGENRSPAGFAITVSASASLYSKAGRKKESAGRAMATASLLAHAAELHVLNR